MRPSRLVRGKYENRLFSYPWNPTKVANESWWKAHRFRYACGVFVCVSKDDAVTTFLPSNLALFHGQCYCSSTVFAVSVNEHAVDRRIKLGRWGCGESKVTTTSCYCIVRCKFICMSRVIYSRSHKSVWFWHGEEAGKTQGTNLARKYLSSCNQAIFPPHDKEGHHHHERISDQKFSSGPFRPPVHSASVHRLAYLFLNVRIY